MLLLKWRKYVVFCNTSASLGSKTYKKLKKKTVVGKI